MPRPDGSRRGRGAASDEDVRLWREATRDVRPLTETTAPPPAPPATPPAARTADVPRPVRLSAVPTAPAQPMSVVHGRGFVAGLDKSSTMRLRRGMLPVEARLDLHGLTQDEAHHALNGFLAVQSGADRRVVLVITGRGFTPFRREPGESGGVLRRSLPRWLHEGANRERVLAYAPAQPRHGGAGAFYVLLRRRRE